MKRNNKYYAHCACCNHDLTNTSFFRLKTLRQINIWITRIYIRHYLCSCCSFV